jgi:hypothetical protein
MNSAFRSIIISIIVSLNFAGAFFPAIDGTVLVDDK